MKKIKGWYMPDREEHFPMYLEKRNTNQYQPEVREQSLKLIKKNRVAIDIGANIGLWGRDLCNKFNHCHFFEPLAINIECLIKNLENYNNKTIHQFALSDNVGEAKLYYSPSEIGGSSLHKEEYQTEIEYVQTKKLDDFEFKNIDYIKIDVQNHEFEVLKGGAETLRNNDCLLCVESPRRNDEELETFKKIKKFLYSLGFKKEGYMGKEFFFTKV